MLVLFSKKFLHAIVDYSLYLWNLKKSKRNYNKMDCLSHLKAKNQISEEKLIVNKA